MSGCCSGKNNARDCDPCNPPVVSACNEVAVRSETVGGDVISWFGGMVEHCYEYACAEKEKGRKIVGIMCEYTPRELIMAAGGVPVCLCGGDAEMIPAAEHDLPANLCPLIKSTYGYSLEKANPFLEMADLLVAETTCDGKKKMYELLAKRHTMHILELPQKPEDAQAFEHWVHELQVLRQRLSVLFNVQVTDESIRAASRLMNRERKLRRDIAALMKADTPPLTGRELLDLKSLISCIPADLEQYEKALRELPGRKLNSNATPGVRVLLTGVPLPHGAERVMEIIEDNGGLVVCQENCTGIKPLIEDVDAEAKDPVRALAEKYFHLPCSVMTENRGRMDLIRQLAAEYRSDCVIELVWQACITYDVESFRVRELVEKETGLPYLRIGTDYSPSDSARIATRVQALFETIPGRSKR